MIIIYWGVLSQGKDPFSTPDFDHGFANMELAAAPESRNVLSISCSKEVLKNVVPRASAS